MKILSILFVSLFTTTVAFAQGTPAASAQSATDELQATYQLSDSQVDDMYKIQLRKYEGLETIASFKSTDETLYYKKLKALKYNTEISVKRLLTKEQMDIYYQKLKEKRLETAEVVKQMRSEGATPEEIERALIEIE